MILLILFYNSRKIIIVVFAEKGNSLYIPKLNVHVIWSLNEPYGRFFFNLGNELDILNKLRVLLL